MNIQIKSEHLPSRCEICHQKDCFDSQLNTCTRCEKLNLKPIDINTAINQYIYNPEIKRVVIVFIIIAFVLFLLSFRFTVFSEYLIVMSAVSLFTGTICPLYYRYRCNRLKWVINNTEAIDIEFILYTTTDICISLYNVDINIDKFTQTHTVLFRPTWDVTNYLDTLKSGLLYLDPKGGIVIRTDQGVLLSWTTNHYQNDIKTI